MDFNLANKYAEQIKQENDDQVRQKLVTACIPYFLHIRKKFHFYSISLKDIRTDLAAEAVDKAFIIQEKRKVYYSRCLQNAFRDCCRERIRITREHDTNNIISKSNLQFPLVIGSSTQPASPQVIVQNNELVELANNILNNHNRFSKQVVYQKTKGSTYPEMADIFSTTLNECRRVYIHDMNDLREKLNPNPKEK